MCILGTNEEKQWKWFSIAHNKRDQAAWGCNTHQNSPAYLTTICWFIILHIFTSSISTLNQWLACLKMIKTALIETQWQDAELGIHSLKFVYLCFAPSAFIFSSQTTLYLPCLPISFLSLKFAIRFISHIVHVKWHCTFSHNCGVLLFGALLFWIYHSLFSIHWIFIQLWKFLQCVTEKVGFPYFIFFLL